MSAHTPGPWGDPTFSSAAYSVWKGDTQIAACRWINETTGQPAAECVQRDAEARANARLIAAAPDLLAALKKHLENFESQHALLLEIGSPQFVDLRDRARAAIAKAEGRS